MQNLANYPILSAHLICSADVIHPHQNRASCAGHQDCQNWLYAVNVIDVGTGIGSNVKVDVSQIVIDNACICTLTALTELKHNSK